MPSYAQFDPQYAATAAMAVGGMTGSDVDALAAAAAVVGDSPSAKRLRTDGGHIPGPAGEDDHTLNEGSL